jgi:hypothetical protein
MKAGNEKKQKKYSMCTKVLQVVSLPKKHKSSLLLGISPATEVEETSKKKENSDSLKNSC